ncbi:MAG: class I SAM-dependent methyltransferase [Bryobacteraceae bacterium]|jgi:SAM-dependent methyltransferase
MRRLALILLLAAVPLAPNAAFAQTAPLRPPDVRYDPSTPTHVLAMLELAGVGKDDIVYDLGCGDGRVVIAAAQRFGARGVGIDIDPKLIQESEANARRAGVSDRVQFRVGDLFTADIHEATVVALYLWPSVNLKLRPKLWKELKPGTRVVSNMHDMGDWKPEKKILADGHYIYLWTIPAVPPRR